MGQVAPLGPTVLRINCVDVRYSGGAVCAFLERDLGRAYVATLAGGSLLAGKKPEAFIRHVAGLVAVLAGAGIAFDEVHLLDHWDADHTCQFGCKAYGDGDFLEAHEANQTAAIRLLRELPAFENARFRAFLHDIERYTLRELTLKPDGTDDRPDGYSGDDSIFAAEEPEMGSPEDA